MKTLFFCLISLASSVFASTKGSDFNEIKVICSTKAKLAHHEMYEMRFHPEKFDLNEIEFAFNLGWLQGRFEAYTDIYEKIN